MSDIYLQITETPTVVTLSAPVVASVMVNTVTVANVVSVNVVTMPAITVQAAAPSVTTVAGTVTIGSCVTHGVNVANSVTISSLPTIAGTVTVGNSVTIGSLPVLLSTTTIGGTARLNVTLSSATTIGATAPSYGNLYGGSDGTNLRAISVDTSGRTVVTGSVSVANTVPISGTVTANISGTSTVTFSAVTGSVSILGTPSVTMGAISGTVTANLNDVVAVGGASSTAKAVAIGHQSDEGTFIHTSLINPLPVNINANAQVPQISGTVTANVFGQSYNGSILPIPVEQESELISDKFIPIGYNCDGDARQVSPTYPLPSAVYGYSLETGTYAKIRTTTLGEVGASLNYPIPSGTNRIGVVTIGGGTVTIGAGTAQIGSVTLSALPSGALTTRFGSVTTANTSQITTAVTNTSRKYLLAQNISTGTVTIGIGFSPTTTQGIQLTAGAGLTFDSFVPTGAVYWLGATTGAAYTILEG